MAGAGPGRAGGSFRGQGRGRGREQRRPPTWEISDSDAEGPVRAEAAARAPDPAEERRAAAEALRLLRPERALRRLAVRVDPAILQDAGADTLMEALGALGCEYLIEPQPQARSLRWSRVRPDPCPRGVPPEVWAENEQEVLLLLEPGEFLRGIARLPKVPGPGCSVPWICPESPARPHLAIIGLDAYLWSQQAGVQGTQWQQESPAAPGAKGAFSWSQVEEALVLLQLWAELDVLLVASWRELSEHVCAFTRALAQRPYKCVPPLPERGLKWGCWLGVCLIGAGGWGAEQGEASRRTPRSAPGDTRSPRPSPSARLGAGQQGSVWHVMARGCGGPGAGRLGSLTESARLWLRPSQPPSHPPASCSRRSQPAALSRSSRPCWWTCLWRLEGARGPAGWGLTSPAASASS
ncbi:probable crossover junction endonuclease EME2 isoform X2 [Choloepus didactylus]|uniref:probable crossover junction endonuclease EME2 isoform X2 n=1 Tax=Choloepus didactylus TaxID=27675 RepID=UPI0018A09E37|nr:probable crossover junction endonuclease EME2 isoform X2 [Choloepus didactylus]